MTGGILLIDKASGISSAAITTKLKKKLGLSKVGHAGTLDPMATGLLVVLANSATRLANFAEKGRKVYKGEIRLGLTTTTDDIQGEALSQSTEIPAFEDVLRESKKFIGEIEQVPPKVSAIKVDGERAYRLARMGQDFKLNARKVNIYSFSIEQKEPSIIAFQIECSSGTYIRAIARDLGKVLGCGACLHSLRRDASFPYHVSQAKNVEDVELSDMQPWVTLFPHVLRVQLEASDARRLHDGDMKSLRNHLQQSVSTASGQDLAIYIDRSSQKPLGLLKNVRGMWEIGVNIAN